MPWFAKRGSGEGRAIEPPEQRQSPYDAAILGSKFDQLVETMGAGLGVEHYIESLAAKQALFEEVVGGADAARLDRDACLALLEYMFTARRKFAGPFVSMALEERERLLEALWDEDTDSLERIRAFAETAPTGGDRKVRRAAWDFAAECLHFRAPERCPLMTRWVWDPATEAGALRELIRGSDGLREVPLGDTSGTYEQAGEWIADQLAERGYYRSIPFLIDLALAQAYSDYMQAMSFNAGMVTGELGAKADPLEFVVKLLGIEPPRRGGRSRVRRYPKGH